LCRARRVFPGEERDVIARPRACDDFIHGIGRERLEFTVIRVCDGEVAVEKPID
jgi:hypothetical protein